MILLCMISASLNVARSELVSLGMLAFARVALVVVVVVVFTKVCAWVPLVFVDELLWFVASRLFELRREGTRLVWPRPIAPAEVTELFTLPLLLNTAGCWNIDVWCRFVDEVKGLLLRKGFDAATFGDELLNSIGAILGALEALLAAGFCN